MVQNFAHRGFAGKYPENTMLAFQKAVELGCDGIELDVQLSKDGEPVIIHDETLDRLTGETGFVADYTLKELKALDAAYRCPEYGPQEIPTLREYFEYIKDTDLITNIELKTTENEYPGIEDRVLSLIREYGLEEKVIISSFNHYSILRIKERMPKILCEFLESSRIIEFCDYTKSRGVEYIHPHFPTVSEAFAREAKEKEIGINAWTADQKEDMRTLIKRGVKAIITNYPDRLKEVLEEQQEDAVE